MPTTMIEGDVLAEIKRLGPAFSMRACYVDTLAPRAAYHAGLFRQILGVIEHPLVIHCSAGKDRTGVAVALLLRLAGASDEDIVADYAQTGVVMADLMAAERIHHRAYGLTDASIDEVQGCPPATMVALLAHLDATFGTVENYLEQGGLRPDEIQRLRDALVVYDRSNGRDGTPHV